jgi:phospholipase C
VHAATSGGLDDSPNSATLAWEIAIKGVQFENGSIYDRINSAAPVTWHVYKDGNFALVEQISGIKSNDSQVHSLDDMKMMLNNYGDTPTYNFIEPKYELIGNYKNGNSQHPFGDVRAGELLIKQVYETLVASPVWGQSLFVIVYDEHGGFYDHVAPPVAVPPGDTTPSGIKSKYGFRFDQYGVRVPALFISPYIPKGTVIKAKPDSQFDHSSIVRTLCDLWDLEPLTNRDRSARSILPELNLTDAPRTDAIATLPDPNVPADILAALSQPPSDTPSGFSDDENAAPLDGVAYSYAHIAMMDKVKGMSDEDATATVAQLSGNLNTKGDAMDFISGAVRDMNDSISYLA